MAFAHATTISDRVQQSVATQRFRGFIFGGLSGMAVLIAIVGVWSLLVFTVLRRTREIGIRMTLGLNAGSAQRRLVGAAMLYALMGVAIGEACALLLARSLNLVVFGLPRLEPVPLVVIGLFFVTIAALAAAGPARRIGRIDPMIALRRP
jgi:ABC-type antimicrobial peptide transport system permease subunit